MSVEQGGRQHGDVDRRARMLDALGQAVIATDVQGVVVHWNPAAERLYGWTAAEALGRPITELTVAPVGQPAASEIMAALTAGVPWTGAFPVRRKDGSVFVALVTDTALYDEAGALEGVVGVSTDLGQALRPYLVQSSEAAVVTGPDAVVYYASPAVTSVFGWDDSALVGRPLTELVHPDDAAQVLEGVATAREGGLTTADFRVRRPDGDWTWVEARWTDMQDDPGVRGIVGLLRDVDERHAVLDRLTDLALHDPLTGLPNRSVVLERIQHATARRERHGAVAFVDLDGFKEVNDTLGHVAGDALLRAVADRLSHAVRPEDTCGRWAGDEFVVVTETVDVRDEADALADRLRTAIEQPLELEGTPVRPRASVGVALLGQASTADEVLRAADLAMYRVKHTRRAREPEE